MIGLLKGLFMVLRVSRFIWHDSVFFVHCLALFVAVNALNCFARFLSLSDVSKALDSRKRALHPQPEVRH